MYINVVILVVLIVLGGSCLLKAFRIRHKKPLLSSTFEFAFLCVGLVGIIIIIPLSVPVLVVLLLYLLFLASMIVYIFLFKDVRTVIFNELRENRKKQ